MTELEVLQSLQGDASEAYYKSRQEVEVGLTWLENEIARIRMVVMGHKKPSVAPLMKAAAHAASTITALGIHAYTYDRLTKKIDKVLDKMHKEDKP